MIKANFTIPKDYFKAKKVDRDLSHPFIKDFFIVCDVGGASGIDTFPIAKRAYFTIDLDVDLNALNIAKMRAKDIEISKNLGFICASATELPFRRKILDMITCFSVIDHIPGKENAQRAISEFSRGFSPREFQNMIKSAGLTPIIFDSRYPTVVGYTLLKWNCPKIIQKVPTRLLYPILMMAEKIFGIIQHVPWLKLFGARMGYLSTPS